MSDPASGSTQSFIDTIPDADLEDLVQSIKDGAKNPGESLGFGPPALASIERMALSYYRGQKYGQAGALYGFVLRMDPKRGSSWRGMGACCHARQFYAAAVRCYDLATQADPSDVISRVFWGECLCAVGKKDEGLKILADVIKKGTSVAAYRPYLARATAIVGAKGGVPPRIVLMNEGRDVTFEATDLMAQTLDGSREMTADDLLQNPQTARLLKEVTQFVKSGRLTLAEVGGFTKNELDGAYACACEYLNMGKVAEGMRIAGFLAYIDPYQARYYQLVGACWQRMKQYVMAEKYYGLALALDETDARSRCFVGECKMLSGEVQAGATVVRKALEFAKAKPEYADVVARAQKLLKQFQPAT